MIYKSKALKHLNPKQLKCYIKGCTYKPNVKLNPHIKPGVVYTNKKGEPSCWFHAKGYLLSEKPHNH